MIKNSLIILLFFAGLVRAGDIVFEPPIIIDPLNPKVGEMVRVGLFERYYPPCLDIPQENSVGETHLISSNQNDLELNVLAITDPQCNPIPFEPAPREYYELGLFEAGEYTLNVNYIQVSGFQPADIPPFPLPDFFFSDSFGSTITFMVRGEPQAINTLSWRTLILLSFLVLFSPFIFKNN